MCIRDRVMNCYKREPPCKTLKWLSDVPGNSAYTEYVNSKSPDNVKADKKASDEYKEAKLRTAGTCPAAMQNAFPTWTGIPGLNCFKPAYHTLIPLKGSDVTQSSTHASFTKNKKTPLIAVAPWFNPAKGFYMNGRNCHAKMAIDHTLSLIHI